VTADTFPILNGLSIKRVVINPGAMRTPHWHANANEFTYCLSGTSLISVLDSGSQFSSFTVSAGEKFHIDSGSLHHIENIGDEVAEFIIAFRHERPEDFGLGAAFGAMTDAVLAQATRSSRRPPISPTRTSSRSKASRLRSASRWDRPGWHGCSSGRR
jgi:oxalate decarboxylase